MVSVGGLDPLGRVRHDDQPGGDVADIQVSVTDRPDAQTSYIIIREVMWLMSRSQLPIDLTHRHRILPIGDVADKIQIYTKMQF